MSAADDILYESIEEAVSVSSPTVTSSASTKTYKCMGRDEYEDRIGKDLDWDFDPNTRRDILKDDDGNTWDLVLDFNGQVEDSDHSFENIQEYDLYNQGINHKYIGKDADDNEIYVDENGRIWMDMDEYSDPSPMKRIDNLEEYLKNQ